MKKTGLLAGLAAGIGLGVLIAPKKGSETRKDLKDKLDDLCKKVKDIDYEEVRTDIEARKILEILKIV